MECLRLRVRDIDFDRGLIFVRRARAKEIGHVPRSSALLKMAKDVFEPEVVELVIVGFVDGGMNL